MVGNRNHVITITDTRTTTSHLLLPERDFSTPDKLANHDMGYRARPMWFPSYCNRFDLAFAQDGLEPNSLAMGTTIACYDLGSLPLELHELYL
ncbi:hypothetical protein SADUNF_Sadunf10G0113600 [Salix dunnii]|uniref:Uncharacterized protein n=1 Tax=Salix dunnii TaxID=1413687 RepID=A0A835JVU9_9ROSI|nr:hypothetical protein SADUNF_Sadunf10G0113600 [Salix dunnii]